MTATHFAEATGIDFEGVRSILTQRFPMLMVDRIHSFEPGVRLAAIKNVSGSDIHFLGHFPHRAVFPGVLLIEAMAQTLYALDVLSGSTQETADLTYLGNASVRFLRPVFPGDQLILEAQVVKRLSSGIVGKVQASVLAEAVAKGELILSRQHTQEGRGTEDGR